jgi:hypothetical protein
LSDRKLHFPSYNLPWAFHLGGGSMNCTCPTPMTLWS